MDGTILADLPRESGEDWSETASQASQSQMSDVTTESRPTLSESRDVTHTRLSPVGDINTAAALRAQYAISTPKQGRRRPRKTATHTATEQKQKQDQDEPLVDKTAALPLHSKKTERLQRKLERKSAKRADYQASITALLSLPSELLTDIFTYLFPTDIASLRLTNRHLNVLTTTYENLIARTMIRRHYWTLYRCFPLPVPFDAVPSDAHAALLSTLRQEMLNIHRKSYHQHVQMIDPHEICTCMTCVFGWNNLCLIVDLHHWQPHLENREPIPIIKRGSNPQWNQTLLLRNADLVRTAITRPLIHARILQMHLHTITSTILRNARWRRKLVPSAPKTIGGGASSSSSGNGSRSTPAKHVASNHYHGRSSFASPVPSTTNNGSTTSGASSIINPTTTTTTTALPSSSMTSKPKLYHLTESDVLRGTDEFLDRPGPPSYDFPYMRDNYYSLEAYVPNRKWSSETARWHFYAMPPFQHERDLEWVRSWASRNEVAGGAGGGSGGGRR